MEFNGDQEKESIICVRIGCIRFLLNNAIGTKISCACPYKLNPLSATYNLQQTTISNFAAFSKITNKAYFMRIVCWQTILMKYHTLFYWKIEKDVVKFVVCCSRDLRVKV